MWAERSWSLDLKLKIAILLKEKTIPSLQNYTSTIKQLGTSKKKLNGNTNSGSWLLGILCPDVVYDKGQVLLLVLQWAICVRILTKGSMTVVTRLAFYLSRDLNPHLYLKVTVSILLASSLLFKTDFKMD